MPPNPFIAVTVTVRFRTPPKRRRRRGGGGRMQDMLAC